jgi:hypothetical protein
MANKSRGDKNDDKSDAPEKNEPWTGDWGSNEEVRKEIDKDNVEDKRYRR